ncbi:BREX-1 system adenine-specific DNA-methyltransferase PglX [Clostridium sp.]|uniref:BREX-1 system adenine-specific DNA-methyltransferase PglX n=1 Tax=Clostridium sp. TaxID=1506 RepID=UPI00290A4A80|nr:BREX-1 system adenine-specific DNA-methyltransferase PglX [Clostridium sp.]MDU5105781.1 BREX-1 system adenine-specific DNA-methyltransferase PglX [Clostridium sp.]
MDKNKIKSFAIWARRNLIASVKDRAKYIGIFIDGNGKYNEIRANPIQGGFTLENIDGVFNLSYSDRQALINRINSYEDKVYGFEQVMEEVAYTWFNRFMGLRYMEVNDYLPSGVRILSSEIEGKKEPDVLTRVSEIIDELKLNANIIYELLDSGKTIDREKAYRIILVKQCNELGNIIPQMFEKISDYTELLLPDNLLQEGSVIRKMVEDIEEYDWKEEVEIIGWMYQYYISEKKDEVFSDLKKNIKITKENIPAATQLFTPKWIVKYMVENSLGRLWIEGHPNEELQKNWKYYLEEAEQEPEVEEELKKIREEHAKLKPEDIKVLDPCMGSGHILVYAFDVLYEIYKSTGYSEREIPRLILQNNLYGLDIDDRAAQLSSFALIMKARHYNRRLFREIKREHLELNLCSIQESNSIGREEIDYFCTLGKDKDNYELRSAMEYLCEVFIDAKEYGSILEVKEFNFKVLKDRLLELEHEDDLMFADYRKILLEKLPIIIKQAEIMKCKYNVCTTNPPYIGNKGLGGKLKDFIVSNYSDVKSDIFSVFIEKNFKYTKRTGYLGLMTPFVWMFISTYEELRKKIISQKFISSLVQLEYSGFSEATVPICTFILRNKNISGEKGEYIRLSEFKGYENQEIKTLEAIANNTVEYRYCKNQNIFNGIPKSTISYWAPDSLTKALLDNKKIKNYGEGRIGMATADNERFLKMWYEIDLNKLGLGFKSRYLAKNSKKKWFPYVKGGGYRKWYGFYEYVVNWENDGNEIRGFKDEKTGRIRSHNYNLDYIFKSGLSWSSMTSYKFSIRFIENSIFGSGGSTIVNIEENNILYMLGMLNSIISDKILEILSSTMNYEVSMIESVPLIIDVNYKSKIDELVRSNIDLSKDDWNSYEISWDYKGNPLINNNEGYKKISESFTVWENKCKDSFNQLKNNEEKLNKAFIDIYSVNRDISYKIEDKDITINKADRERDIKSFISYAIGCILGRYSIDVEGLIYAGGEFNNKWNIADKKVRKIEKDEDGNIISDNWIDSRFLPDSDNIIPITEDEFFEDDIVSRFIDFVRTVYGNDTLEENLDFIADSIGRKTSETSRQSIRRYFIKDFYKDHLKVYQKRPIYWMFESGKNDGFKCLIYMHRYNEQTVAKVRTDYLHTLQRKYEAEINRLQLIVDSEDYTVKDRTSAKKKLDRISKQIEECREYDKVVAHLANEKISIDLDDGVKVNYAKFQEVKVINSKGKEVKMNLLAKI